MVRDKLYWENRIAKLSQKPVENRRHILKALRYLRKFENENSNPKI